MKSPNITTIILEGTDGVGKSTMIQELFKILGYRFMIYHRGELSNLVYARKFHRPFYATQVGLPFLHVLLVCDKEELKKRIIRRDSNDYEEMQKELAKVQDQREFFRTACEMQNDYHVMIFDTSNMSIESCANKLATSILDYIDRLPMDDDLTTWNQMYAKVCKELAIPFCVRDNQPYINNIAVMVESTLHNGVYEQFADKRYPDNLLYSLGYDISRREVESIEKQYDFAYIINSKIRRRTEVYDYYLEFSRNNKSCITSDYREIPRYPNFIRTSRFFGNDFIKVIAQAKATVYTARDLAYLKLQTARLYESIIAQQIVFVDEESDKDSDMLIQIHKNADIVEMLTVTPLTICKKYDMIMSNEELVKKILSNQNAWYEDMKKYAITGGKFNER